MKVRLGDVCEILDSKRVPIKEADRNVGIYPYYGANGIQGYIDDYIFDDELVLLAEDGGHFGSKDKPIAYRVSGKCWVNNHAHVLKPKEMIDVDYLCYSLMFYDVSSFVNGATRKKLTQLDMRKMEIPFLPINEQKRIAKILDKANELIAKRHKQLEKLDELVKARFVEMFGDPISNPYSFQKVELSELAEIKIGPFGSLLHKDDYIRGGHPVINPSHIIYGKVVVDRNLTISSGKYEELKSYQLCIDDVILGRRGEMGRCAVIKENGLLCGTGSLLIRPKSEVTAEYIQQVISFPTFKKSIEDMAVGQTMTNLNVSIVSGFKIIKPPVEIQKQYNSFLAKIEKSKCSVKKSLEKLEVLKKSLMQKYFTGSC